MKRFRPFVEVLELRLVLSTVSGHAVDQPLKPGGAYAPVVMAGTVAADTPEARAATANADSRFDGVGSLFLRKGKGPVGALCTAAPIRTTIHSSANTFLLTAGHCVDSNDDGIADYSPDRVTFFPDGNTSAGIVAKRLVAHPDFKGFINDINNDLAIVELASPLPPDSPVYELDVLKVDEAAGVNEAVGTTVTLTGFGGSGNGDVGATVGASLSVKRTGKNVIDATFDGGEGWIADFDHPSIKYLNQMGGGTLGDTIETIQVQGDSGGPIFTDDGTTLRVAGTMTYGQDTEVASFPKFGSLAGGMLISQAFVDWIDMVMDGGAGGGSSGGDSGGGGSKSCNPKKPGCSGSGMAHLDAEFMADVVIRSDWSADPNGSTRLATSAAEADPLGDAENTQDICYSPQIVESADTEGDRSSIEVEREIESSNSVDLLLAAWPSGQQTELEGDLFLL